MFGLPPRPCGPRARWHASAPPYRNDDRIILLGRLVMTTTLDRLHLLRRIAEFCNHRSPNVEALEALRTGSSTAESTTVQRTSIAHVRQ